MSTPLEVVLYDDEYGKDLLIAGLHNVNLDWEGGTLSTSTHTTRDGKPMEVCYQPTPGTYFVVVSR